jgi:hypothetical protein
MADSAAKFGVRAHLNQNSGSEPFFWKHLQRNASMEDLPSRPFWHTSFASQPILAKHVCPLGLQRKIALTPNFPKNVL